LVEVNPRSAPPVCRIMDFGKFKYETSKKEKASRKHQSTVVVKEIKLRPKTNDHDLDFKVKHIRRFLSEGNKARPLLQGYNQWVRNDQHATELRFLGAQLSRSVKCPPPKL